MCRLCFCLADSVLWSVIFGSILRRKTKWCWPPAPRSAALPPTTRQPTTNISYERKKDFSYSLQRQSPTNDRRLTVCPRDHPFPLSLNVCSVLSVTLCRWEASLCSCLTTRIIWVLSRRPKIEKNKHSLYNSCFNFGWRYNSKYWENI